MSEGGAGSARARHRGQPGPHRAEKRAGHKKKGRVLAARGLLSNNPATTYFRAFGTIIGVGGLTAVFEMGTGVALRL